MSLVELMGYPKYDSYKDSGVDWLGEIPSDWELRPAFKYIKENKNKNTGLLENTVLSLSYGKIIIKPEEKLTGLVPESFETYQIVEPSDIIIRCTDLQNDKVSLRTGLVENKGIITSAYLGLKVFQNYNPKFLHYYLHSLDITKAIYKFGTGLRQNLSFLDFKRLPLVEISLELQQKIANFLDQKTAQIDQAIALKQQQIEKLGEYKQIVIQNAVTKGLNPNVPMKDSGVAWIGDIPEHWGVKKLKYILKTYNKKISSRNSDLRYLGMENIISKIGEINNGNSEVEGLANHFKPNQILFGKLRPYLAKVYLADFEGICSTEFMVFEVLEPNNAKFFQILLLSNGFIRNIDSSTYGSKMPRANPDFINNQFIVIPPNNEQFKIIEYIESLNRKISDAIQSYQSQIDRLKEYKNILINQAVTGKIKI